MTSTKAITVQVLAIASAIIGIIVAAGLPLSKDVTDHILNLITVTTPLVILAVSWLHHNHARIVAAREAQVAQARVNV